MTLNLEELGITKNDLIDRMLDRMVDSLSNDEHFYTRMESALARRIDDGVKKAVDSVTQTEITDAVKAAVNKPWPITNYYGEDKKAPQTFREMVADKVDAYLNEKVRESTGDKSDYYTDKTCSRVDWIIRHQVSGCVGKLVEAAAAEAAVKAREEVLGKMNAAVIAAVKNVMGIK